MNSTPFRLLRFEVHYQFSQPITWLYAILTAGQGLWNSLEAHQQLGSRLLWTNSAANTYLVLSSPGLVLTVVACLLAGQALTKDLDYRVADYAYATPVAEREYFLGKLLGTLCTVYLLALAYPIGSLLTPLLADGTTGPLPIGQLIDSFIRVLAQNLFIIVSIVFSITVFTRRMTGAYIVMFGMILYFLIASEQTGGSQVNDLLLLLDPFGMGMVREALFMMPIADKNAGYLDYPAMLLINRILWMGLSFGLLAQAERSFSFLSFRIETSRTNTSRIVSFMRDSLGRSRTVLPDTVKFPMVVQLAAHELRGMLKQTAFQVVLTLLLILFVAFVIASTANSDFPVLLTTGRLIAIREPLAIYIGLFLMVFSGELVFRERLANLSGIYDSMPVATITLVVAKWLAMVALAALLAFVVNVAGIAIQLTIGTPVDAKLYSDDLCLAFLLYVQWVSLGFAVAVCVNHRLASHVIGVMLLAVFLLMPRFGIESAGRWLYGWLPGNGAYSELNGYGAFLSARWLFSGLWTIAAPGLVALAVWGYDRGLSGRLERWKYGFRWTYAGGIALVALLISLLYSVITQQNYDQPARLMAQTRQDWASQEQRTLKMASMIVRVADRAIPVTIRYKHAGSINVWQQVIRDALGYGTKLFGAFPYKDLTLTEAPTTTETTRSLPGLIWLVETEGWLANTADTTKLDYLHYVLTREVLKQWTNRQVASGAGFVQNGLVEYLALNSVKERFGEYRLRERLAQRMARYQHGRQVQAVFEPTIRESHGSLYVERDRAALALASMAEVWGDKPLSLSIGQFFRQADKPESLTSAAFVRHLSTSLPDSIQFLTSYLTSRPLFDLAILRINRTGDAIILSVNSEKWIDNGFGQLTPQLPADAVPLVVLDQSGREIYRQLVWPTAQAKPLWLPNLPTARTVMLDPLGAWLDTDRFNNRRDIL